MWRFWIDRGGTFTDIVARRPDGVLLTCKKLSENPLLYDDAALAGMRELLGCPTDSPIPRALIHSVTIGTTVATNALLQRTGARTLLIVNAGFADLLRIADQTRPDLFDLSARRVAPLHEAVMEVSARIAADGAVIEPLDEASAARTLAAVRADGLQTCAIALMHAWRFPDHEQRLAELARAAGFTEICTSHGVSPLPRLVARAQTTLADAYMSPVVQAYTRQLASSLPGVELHFMQSHGGLTGAARFRGKDAVLSGPAGGIVGAARTAEAAGFPRVISFDMGGTSTDVALYDGAFERTHDAEIAGVRLRTPMLAIHTIAAGGGSLLHYDGARLRVGPKSAGARPGPLAYRQGGALTVTDANICVGRIQPRHFPPIFGPSGDAALDAASVATEFAALAAQIGDAERSSRDPREIADGFLRVAVAHMAGAVKRVSIARGRDPRAFALQCFGGAGGQLACAVADALGIETVLVHPYAGVLSAYGMGLADHGAMREQAVDRALDDAVISELGRLADDLGGRCIQALPQRAGAAPRVQTQRTAHLRLQGSDAVLAVPLGDFAAMTADFARAHQAHFGFAMPDRPIVVAWLRVEVTSRDETSFAVLPASSGARGPVVIDRVILWTGGQAHQAPVFDRADLRQGDHLMGPALVRAADSMTVIDPGWDATVASGAMLVLRRVSPPDSVPPDVSAKADPVMLEVFHALFMGAAEQAGQVLQRTALSVNIKERLDFSCAVFDAQGGLIANAPHVPVHLGAMGESVRTVLARRATTLREGDSIALNDPYAGGTHLPDITVVTPVFDAAGALRAFVASRAHHADIGGLTPGSTPPSSTCLTQEGVVIDNFLLAHDGTFDAAGFRALLLNGPYPARNPEMNLADIVAQMAANAACVAELRRVAAQYGWDTTNAYMGHVMDNGAASMRRLIGRLRDGAFATTMDDGALLQVCLRVDRAAERLEIDFTGTSAQRAGNFNAPPAVTRAVVLYALRCLIGEEIPLNDGCLRQLRLVIPPGSFLAPHSGAAVVAGNTEVSQAVCNALLGAAGAAASSQATMNNFIFGDAARQYYETICGGAGAGPGWQGGDAVQTHMTNTAMTDPEILEQRMPVRVEAFSIRHRSGGTGAHRGGDGAVRRLRFLEPMEVSLVASRRRDGPFGLAGGQAGLPGRQWLDHSDGRRSDLPGVAHIFVEPGDAITIETPGGGGFGPACKD